MRSALVLLALLLAGCLDAGPAPPVDAGSEPVPFRSLLHAAGQPSVDGPFEGALGRAEWEAAWARYASAHEPTPARPYVDHERQRILAVALGQEGSGCHDVRIERVERAGGELVVSVVEYDGESPTTSCTAQVVWPAHVVAVNDTATPLRFERRLVGPGAELPFLAERPDVERLSVRTLGEAGFSGIQEDRRMVLRDEAAYAAFWAEAMGDIPRPPVEFPNESVLAIVVHGSTGCGGAHVREAAYDVEARVTRAEVLLDGSDPGTSCLVDFRDFAHVVAVPAREGEVRFEDTRTGSLPERPFDPSVTPPPPRPMEAPPGEYAFRTLAEGGHSGLADARREVVRNASAWRAVWEEHTSVVSPAPELPEVDFSREHVLVVAEGSRPSTCWSVRVERVEVRERDVLVEIDAQGPPPGAVCGMAVTHPHHFVTYPITSKPLTEASGHAGDG